MGSKYLYPGLTVEGWTKSSLQVADALLCDFFLSEYSQTELWPEQVSSFPWMLQQYVNDSPRLCALIQEGLTKLIKTQFDNVDCAVSLQSVENSINQYSLLIYLTFTDTENALLELSKIILHNDLQVTQILNYLRNAEEA